MRRRATRTRLAGAGVRPRRHGVAVRLLPLSAVMITATTKVRVDGLTGKEITDFMLHAGDEEYQRWWPGTHLRYHAVRVVKGDIGSVVYFDEYVGRRRLKIEGVLRESVPGRRLVLQLKRGVALPVWLVLELEDVEGGVVVTHTLRAGYHGAGLVLDPLFRLYLSPSFRKAMDEHARTEFTRLGAMLHPAPA